MGITNELFQTERDENPTRQFDTVPNDVTKTDGKTPPKNQPRSKLRLTIHRAGIAGANLPAELAARTGSLMTTTS
jgi:hypothetical protein